MFPHLRGDPLGQSIGVGVTFSRELRHANPFRAGILGIGSRPPWGAERIIGNMPARTVSSDSAFRFSCAHRGEFNNAIAINRSRIAIRFGGGLMVMCSPTGKPLAYSTTPVGRNPERETRPRPGIESKVRSSGTTKLLQLRIFFTKVIEKARGKRLRLEFDGALRLDPGFGIPLLAVQRDRPFSPARRVFGIDL